MLTNFSLSVSQLATNTLERVAPLTHAVGNVLKRVFVIGFSIVVFGNVYFFFLQLRVFRFIFPKSISHLQLTMHQSPQVTRFRHKQQLEQP